MHSVFLCELELLSCVFIFQPEGNPFCISSRAGSLVMNSVLFIWGFLSFPFILKNNFARYRALGWWPFSPRTLSSHCLLVYTVSYEKLATSILIESSSCRILTDFKIFSFDNLITICTFLAAFELNLFHWISWMCRFMSFIKFGNFLSNIFQVVFLFLSPISLKLPPCTC